jgi:hypothetical protein
MKLLLTAALVLCTAPAIAAQQTQPANGCPPPRSLRINVDSVKPDIAIFARVQADELRFNSAPRSSLELFGCPQIDTSLVVLRTNLPTPVQPGVTYRNVTVDFRLNMKFSELECYLDPRRCPAAGDSIR